MPLPRSFIRAWHEWRHAVCPLSNDYVQNRDSPCFSVEHDLDHMDSWLYCIGNSVIEGKVYEYNQIASEALGELNGISALLEKCDIPENEKKEFQEYILIVRKLWKEIYKISLAQKV
jgi:hypothetical protein